MYVSKRCYRGSVCGSGYDNRPRFGPSRSGLVRPVANVKLLLRIMVGVTFEGKLSINHPKPPLRMALAASKGFREKPTEHSRLRARSGDGQVLVYRELAERKLQNEGNCCTRRISEVGREGLTIKERECVEDRARRGRESGHAREAGRCPPRTVRGRRSSTLVWRVRTRQRRVPPARSADDVTESGQSEMKVVEEIRDDG